MKKRLSITALLGGLFLTTSVFGQAGLVISEVLANPNGTDSPFEYVELVATQNINFATTPYTIVWTNNGTATSNGWKEGGAITYAFQVNSGSVTAGQVVYVGGSSMLPLSHSGVSIRTINTSTTNGDFGTKSSDVLGNGGSNCDGVAVFNMSASTITGTKVPVDAIFYGTSTGSAFKTTGSGYQLPMNDKYAGGKLLTTSFLAPDPGADDLVKATAGTYNPSSNSWTTVRTWATTTTATYNTTSIVIGGASNLAPTVSITAPATGATFTAPATVSITANASDADGTVSKVEFYNGTTLLGSDLSSPYSFSWTGVAAGTYSLTAKAYDNLSAITTSTAVSITVNAGSNIAPTVSITAPATGATFTAPATVSITANASDADGTVSKVEFYNGSTLLGSDLSSPYSFSWTGVAAGTYSITAKAYDNLSAITTSTAVAITVNAGANQAPIVSITAPATGATFTAPATVSITANASDVDGTISKVEFYNGTTLLGSDVSGPYSYSWSSVATGTYTLTAKAYDNLNVTTTSASVSITVNATNATPTIAFLPSASKLVDEASKKISCVMNNSTDPVIVSGLDITVTDEDPASLIFSMTSSKTSVVPNNAITVTGTGTTRKVKINPTGVGYANITLKITDNGGKTATLPVFALAVSASIATTTVKDIYNTGMSDGSTGVPIDANYMFVADDETNQIRLVDRNNSGLPLYQLDVTPYLSLGGKEVDIEASFRSTSAAHPNRIYWLGSMSNNKDGDPAADRNRLFATDIVGSGATATLTFVGYYSNLRSKLISWGDSHGYNFTSKAASGSDPKTINGFNAEGFEMGPDGTTAYIGFRAPYVGSPQNKGLICPITNFETWFGNGSPSASPVFGAPIELNLGTRGIRSLCKNAANQFIISAGPYDDNGTFALYEWNGLASDIPTLISADLTGLRPEGIVEVPASASGSFQLQLISDFGSTEWYNDGTENKDLTENNYKKYMTSIVSVNSTRMEMIAADNLETPDKAIPAFKAYPNPTASVVTIEFSSAATANSIISVYSMQGALVKQIAANALNSSLELDLSDLKSGNYLINLEGTGDHLIISKQ